MPETQQIVACDADFRKIIEWTKAWYEQAVCANFISRLYYPDREVVTRLREYYRAGLTPAEAIQACFGVSH
jgi:hypothetical protein